MRHSFLCVPNDDLTRHYEREMTRPAGINLSTATSPSSKMKVNEVMDVIVAAARRGNGRACHLLHEEGAERRQKDFVDDKVASFDPNCDRQIYWSDNLQVDNVRAMPSKASETLDE